jgi:hypothetical protein
MLNHFIYSTPTWLWGAIVVMCFVTMASIGLTIFNRFVSVEVRRAHNDLAGFTVAIVAVTYAVLLAFIAVATWETYSRAQEIVEREAAFVGNIYRDTVGLPGDVGIGIRADLKDYIRMVVEEEWPEQQNGETPSSAWTPLYKLHAAIVTLRPENQGEAVVEAELLKTLNDLYAARANRISAAEGHIPEVVWWLILLGGMITTGYVYLFGFHSFRMHLTMTAAISASLALVVVLIMALDWPFRGEVSISSDAFVKVQQSWSDMKFDKP